MNMNTAFADYAHNALVAAKADKKDDLVVLAQSMANNAKGPKVRKVRIDDVLADLRQVGISVAIDHKAAVRSLYADVTNADDSPIEAYIAMKGTFGDKVPTFANWVNGHK